MNWDAVAAVAEICGAAGVIVTLIYLALQVRQNTRALDHSTLRAALQDAFDWRNGLIQSREVAQLYRAGMLDSEGLDEVDALRFRMLMDSLFSSWDYSYMSRSGLAEAQLKFIRRTLQAPGGARYWARRKTIFGAGFVSYVDSLGIA